MAEHLLRGKHLLYCEKHTQLTTLPCSRAATLINHAALCLVNTHMLL